MLFNVNYFINCTEFNLIVKFYQVIYILTETWTQNNLLNNMKIDETVQHWGEQATGKCAGKVEIMKWQSYGKCMSVWVR